jgi:hypothetical protein
MVERGGPSPSQRPSTEAGTPKPRKIPVSVRDRRVSKNVQRCQLLTLRVAIRSERNMRVSETPQAVIRLFSYGTLQQPEVQRALFGRELAGTPDRLPGYEFSMLPIADSEVAALSGSARHPIVHATGRPSDEVAGTVFEISPAELAAADAYEVDDYTRVLVELASGLRAWVYAAPPVHS